MVVHVGCVVLTVIAYGETGPLAWNTLRPLSDVLVYVGGPAYDLLHRSAIEWSPQTATHVGEACAKNNEVERKSDQ